MTVDRHIVGRVGHNERCPVLAHQGRPRALIQCVAADQQVIAERPDIASACNRRSCAGPEFRLELVVIAVKSLDLQLNLDLREARCLDVEVEVLCLKVKQNGLQCAFVPFRQIRQAIEGNHQRLDLRLSQIVDADHHDLGEPQPLCDFDLGMTGDDAAISIDQDRQDLTECLIGLGQRPDLRLRMLPRRARHGLQRPGREIFRLQADIVVGRMGPRHWIAPFEWWSKSIVTYFDYGAG